MKAIGEIEIRITGRNGNIALSPDTYDVKYIREMISNIENLLFPDSKRNRPLISYNLEEGSVIHKFKTSMQQILAASAILLQVNQSQSIDFLEAKSADAIENIQKLAIKKNYEFQLKTSHSHDPELTINSNTRFFQSEELWADAEFYLYGEIRDAGGSTSINIHLKTDDYGTLIIDTDEASLKAVPENMVFRTYGVRARGKQNIQTGEMDTRSLKLIELLDYSSSFDEDYLNKLIAKASKTWKGIDAEAWLDEIRGDYAE